ncbi:MAG: FAD binding domain-containing protein, partial [Chloroflexota bacterium]|nr:FAD binding domain-containing protein [Chloroflexota bacterium]
MLRLPGFEYHSPATIEEAVQLLGELQPDVMVMAGGTDLLPNMKRKLVEPKHLIGLSQVRDLDYVRTDPDGTVRIGAGTSLSTVARHPELARYPGLRSAAASGSTPHLQNMGTVGGNLCLDTRCTYYDQSFFWRQALGFCLKNGGTICRVAPSSPVCLATHSADTVPAFMVLDADVSVVGPNGPRVTKVADLYRNDGKDFLQLGRNEILTEVRVPSHDGYHTSY